MCNPGILAIAGAATSAAGQIQAGNYAARMAHQRAGIAAENKKRVRENANEAIGDAQDQQLQLGREIAALIGAQTARIGAGNVDPTFGSAARMIDDTRLIGAEDSEAMAENVRRTVRGFSTDMRNLEGERRAARAEGYQALAASRFGAVTTVLGGATQYADFQRRQNDPNG